MTAWLGRLQRMADIVATLLMGTMFVSFIVQVGARYVFNAPVSWADELSVIMGIWAILWATSFCTREADNIRFDMIYTLVRPPTRRVFDLITSAALVAIFTISLPAVWKYVTFMKIEATAAMHIRYDLVFSIYLIFVLAMIVRHLVIFWDALRGREQDTPPAVPLATE